MMKQTYLTEQDLKHAIRFTDGIVVVDHEKLGQDYLPVHVYTKSGHIIATSLKLDCKFYDLAQAPGMVTKPHILYKQWWMWMLFIVLFCMFWVLVAQYAPQ